MAFSSFNFFCFLAVVITVYYLVPKKFQWAVLLVASYAFYLSSGVDNVVYILFTTFFTYGSGLWMQKIRDNSQKKADALGSELTKEQKREMKKEVAAKVKRIQVFTVLVNLGILAYMKYLNFFIEGINNAFGFFHWDASVPYINLIVPLGLSYYTFNSIGYLVDVGRGKYAAERHLGKFALFVSFFPSIVQGPLCRFGDVGRQLQAEHKFEYDNIKYGAQLMLWGLFKKLVIADRVAPIVGAIFADGFAYEGYHVFFGVLAYSFQIYGDFSGGTDITRGAAQMMGIDLPVNFNQPFFATSMADFWHRWHMSLGAWMREYVFYPVMLSKPVTAVSKYCRKKYGAHIGKVVPSVAAPMVVFFLMNIWHGLGAQRVTNAFYNAFIISSTVALTPFYKKLGEKLRVNTECFSFRLFQMARTFALLCVSRIITLAPSLSVAFDMLKELVKGRIFLTATGLDFMLGGSKEIFSYGVNRKNMIVLLFAVLIMFTVEILRESGIKIRESLAKQNTLFRWAVILCLMLIVLVFGIYGPGYDPRDFIYGGY